jgi:all-trans-retinol dehydrogenase (NAD+)
MDLKNKCAVVTGGAMGIGLATARRLLKEGCAVTIWDINNDALNSVLAELKKNSDKIFGYKCDVTDQKRISDLAFKAIADMGKVDILINNAGYVKKGSLLDQPIEEWQKTIDINLTALIYTIRAFLPGMHERNSGHIVNISSAAGLLGVPNLSVYCATKWAVWGLTESLRFEAINNGKKGVKYSSIHPSYLATGMFEGAKLSKLGNLIVPLVKDHDVIAKAIVESALKKGKYSPKRPVTLNLTLRMRAILPDALFQRFLMILGVHKSMSGFKGRENQ